MADGTSARLRRRDRRGARDLSRAGGDHCGGVERKSAWHSGRPDGADSNRWSWTARSAPKWCRTWWWRRRSQRSSVCEPQFGVAAQNFGPYAYARDLSESQPVKETTSVDPRTPGPQGLG